MRGTQIVLMYIYLVSTEYHTLASGKSCSDKKSTIASCHCQPICGNDGFTYTDQCFLDAYNKECSKDVKVASAGPCKGKMKLVPVTECYPGNGMCNKNTNKPKIYDPVCSTSGTQGNPCNFHHARKNSTKIYQLAMCPEVEKELEFVKCGEC